MDDFREWLSDNLRYILLGITILIVLVFVFWGIRSCLKLWKGSSDTFQNVEQDSSPSVKNQSEKNSANQISTDIVSSLEKDAHPEVNAIIKEYFTAYAQRDVTAMKNLMDILLPEDEEALHNSNQLIEEYQVKDVYTQPGLTDGSYVVFVKYDMICDGVSVPALSQFYVITDQNGTLKIAGNTKNDASVSSYITKLFQNEDVKALVSEVNQEYQAVKQQFPELNM